ncbi:MAG: hypothetical protein JWM96_1145 [Alphaproteobacteria bacterium]|nr:hypothetical protein [Alphaproteobacteria bacterium]
MSEAAATRYLLSRGWNLIEDDWFSLQGMYDSPVCIETAFQLQKRLDTMSTMAA